MQDQRNEPSPYENYFVSNIELREEEGGVSGKVAAAARILLSREAEQKIDALLEAERPDIAHLHNVYHQLSPSILRALNRRGVPVVLTLHDYQLICPAYTLYTQGQVCERCRGGRFYNAVRYSCVKGSRGKSTLCAVRATSTPAQGLSPKCQVLRRAEPLYGEESDRVWHRSPPRNLRSELHRCGARRAVRARGEVFPLCRPAGESKGRHDVAPGDEPRARRGRRAVADRRRRRRAAEA